MRTLTLTLLCLLALSACGGHDHDENVGQMPPPGAGGTAPPDVFAAQVATVVASQPDDTEPPALDATPPTMPENTEPVPVP
jgi:hypothetical protein